MTNKPKLIIVNNNLAIGGIQKALVNLLNEIKDMYDITLFLFSNSGTYHQGIPSGVQIIEGNKLVKLLGVSQDESKKLGPLYFILRGLFVLWTRRINNNVPFKIIFANQKKLQGFDVAISYLHSSNDHSFYGGCNEFVLDRIEAPKKVSFIHCDYLNFGGNTPRNNKNYEKFDRVVAVSEGCKTNLITAIPKLGNKTNIVRNCHNFNDILEKSNISPIQYNNESFHIVTVSRLSDEKGIIRTIEGIAQLVKKRHRLCWHIIGDGYLKKEIEKNIETYHLNETIKLYGNQANPYRFMKNADLVLLPSIHEAAPMVIDEVKCLGIPILSTRTTSSKEMIEDCYAGWVCENSVEGIVQKLDYIMNNSSELTEVKEKLKLQQFSNHSAIEQFRTVLNGLMGYK